MFIEFVGLMQGQQALPQRIHGLCLLEAGVPAPP